jgi:ATP-dependent helicase/nuclease subunit A
VAEAARARLSWLRAQIDFLSPYEYLAQFLGAQGGHKALAARLGSEIDDPLHELMQLALSYEARHAGGMQGFVHWLRQGSQEIKRDMEAGGAAVRIMTVHGAKGLEAPIVFLPDTCRPAKKRGGARARMQFDAEKRPLWRANQALRDPYNAAQAEADEEAQAQEEKRLLYVAMTRARDRLYIGGWLGAGETAAPEDSWYAMIDSALDDGLRGELAAGEGPLPRPSTDDAGREGEDEAAADDAPPLTAEAPAWVNTKPAISAQGEAFIGMKIFSPSSLHEDDAAPDRQAVLPEAQDEAQGEGQDEARARAIARGQIIHKILEWVPGLPDEAREKAALALAGKYAATKNDPTAQALDADALKAAVDEALALMRAPELADLFSAAARAEAAIVGNLPLPDGRQLALAGQIDRMVETDEAIVLVDFKTGMPASDGPVAAGYVTQMAAYRGLIQAAKGTKKPIRCALVWTQNGHIDWLREADMQAALAAL